MTDQLPEEVRLLHETLAALPGVNGVNSGVVSLEEVQPEMFGEIDCALLPLAALRRTDGGLPGEALLQIEFGLTPTLDGWRTLEFLAWVTRDLSRSHMAAQMRPIAFPPVAGDAFQFGKSLRFFIEIFVTLEGEDLTSALTTAGAFAEHLRTVINLYGDAYEKSGATPIRGIGKEEAER